MIRAGAGVGRNIRNVMGRNAMFVKLYKYQIRRADLQKWEKINNAANKIYEHYGRVDFETLLRKEKYYIEVIELNRYASKNIFQKIIKEVDKDRRITKLYASFLKLVYKNKILEDEFETT